MHIDNFLLLILHIYIHIVYIFYTYTNEISYFYKLLKYSIKLTFRICAFQIELHLTFLDIQISLVCFINNYII